jgi:hypothetical protein
MSLVSSNRKVMIVASCNGGRKTSTCGTYLGNLSIVQYRKNGVSWKQIPKTLGDEQLNRMLVELANFANGFTNQAAHIIGYLVYVVLNNKEQGDIPPDGVLDDLVG